ncbi:hypothetical protein KY339_00200 [Candidatus Woesearchaeota archaeon]|nr:hypothetical protein [Candidatus Woesearchaeota archaeon]
MSFDKIVRDIKTLKIQGAENIARQAVLAIKDVLGKNKKHTAAELEKKLKACRKILEDARPTEPCMRNALKYIFSGSMTKDELDKRIKLVTKHFDASLKKIASIGARKIKNGMVVYTHCHSSTVTAILKEAKAQGKRFEVHNTETRPKYQGRITAAELAKEGIPVTHYVDSAAKIALEKADIMMIGADAITSVGQVINKIGSELISEAAKDHSVLIYVCADSWKLDPKTIYGFEEVIEERAKEEVWPKAPKKVKISNPAFETVRPDIITALISELGVYKPEIFVEEVKKEYHWMFT